MHYFPVKVIMKIASMFHLNWCTNFESTWWHHGLTEIS